MHNTDGAPKRIKIHGARVHNLKNINVEIPLNQIVGIAGVSGSGKSSLALGVVYAEGSRRYLESLSTYTLSLIHICLAYVDWYQDQQPTKEEAFSKLLPRIHPGAIVLLHNTSATNGNILDELLAKWEEQGYTCLLYTSRPHGIPSMRHRIIQAFTWMARSISYGIRSIMRR